MENFNFKNAKFKKNIIIDENNHFLINDRQIIHFKIEKSLFNVIEICKFFEKFINKLSTFIYFKL